MDEFAEICQLHSRNISKKHNRGENGHCDILTFIAGTFVLAIVTIPTVLILLKDFGVISKLLRTKKCYWIWDTISLHCRNGINYYLLALICGYCSVYMTAIKMLEFNTHHNKHLNITILWINLISYQFLLGVGILETHPHPFKRSQKIKARLHIVSAGIFFILNICTNMFWTILCVRSKWYTGYTSISIHCILTILALILFILVVITSSINIWFLSKYSPISIFERWHSKTDVWGYFARRLVVPIDNLNDRSWCIILSQDRRGFPSIEASSSQQLNATATMATGKSLTSTSLNSDSEFMALSHSESSSAHNKVPGDFNHDPHSHSSNLRHYDTFKSSGKHSTHLGSSSICSTQQTHVPFDRVSDSMPEEQRSLLTVESERERFESREQLLDHVCNSTDVSVTEISSHRSGNGGMNGCNCLQRRQIYLFCGLNYLLELGLIVCTVSATLLHSAIKNKNFQPLYITQFNNSFYEDLCWMNYTG